MPSERYRATVQLTYPSPGSLKAVESAGGLSKLTDAQREKVTLKHVKAGAYADGVPEKSVKWLLKQGLIKKSGGRD